MLLVDDVEDQREMYAGYLRHVGFEVVEASGGIDAVARTVELGPDVVIMDLAMPGMDGFACTRILKGLPLTRHIPVAALTAHGDHLPREWAQGAGCDAYFRKPMSPIELAERIDGLLDAHRRT